MAALGLERKHGCMESRTTKRKHGKIIDAHAHIYPDAIARRAAQSTCDFYDGLPGRFDGRLDTLLEEEARLGIAAAVMLPVAVTPAQAQAVNRFAEETARHWPGRILPFAGLHPMDENLESEIDDIERRGFIGIKLHPDIQKVDVNGPECRRMAERIQGRMPLYLHAGDARFHYSNPERIARLMDDFPDLEIICAHMGGWSEWPQARKYLKGRNIWVDTSSTMEFTTVEQAMECLDCFGVERTFFGTDYPLWSMERAVENIYAMPLDEAQREAVFHGNIERFLEERRAQACAVCGSGGILF